LDFYHSLIKKVYYQKGGKFRKKKVGGLNRWLGIPGIRFRETFPKGFLNLIFLRIERVGRFLRGINQLSFNSSFF